MRAFTVIVDGEESARLVIAVREDGELLVASDDGRLRWVRAETCRLGQRYLSADEERWWGQLTGAPTHTH